MTKHSDYNEVEEQELDKRFMIWIVLPIMIILLVIASVWTYANMVQGIA